MADEDLAYGDLPGPPPEGGERGIVGDTLRKFGKKPGVGSFLSKLGDAVDKVGQHLEDRLSAKPSQFAAFPTESGQHRFNSFAAPCNGNNVKWYVDGAGYFWAVSLALEKARESIWILDWWLSPELYLRRPPSKNEQYRLDRMLKAAAERGVKVHVIVYKEVTQALTRKYLSPTLPDYLHSLLHPGVDGFTSFLTRLGLAATFVSLETVERESPLIEPPLPVSSEHTKQALEALHPNISVFRHPDHLPDPKVFQSSLLQSLKNTTITAQTAAKLPSDALKALYGMNDDIILYWAHHEKLCLIDGTTAFMGGLDLCYGRWDLNQHPIADAHPEDLDAIIWPGQDYNNARIMDFADVKHWQENKLDRKDSSRMGWSDISIGMHGPVVDDLRWHFVGRWNFIYNEKYALDKNSRYYPLSTSGEPMRPPQVPQSQPTTQSLQQTTFPPPPSGAPPAQNYPPPPPGPPPQQNFPPPPPGPPPQQNYPPPPPGPPPKQDFPPPPPGPPPKHDNQSFAPDPSFQQSGPVELSGESAQPHFAPPPTTSSAELSGEPTAPQFPPPPNTSSAGQDPQAYSYHQESYTHPQPQYQAYHPPGINRQSDSTDRGFGSSGKRSSRMERIEREGEHLFERFEDSMHISEEPRSQPALASRSRAAGRMGCQIVRSATKWSNGTATEHSVQNAYAAVIQRSQHFVYIENQFFITATGNKQKPFYNQIGQAIVERILRAARAGEKYKVIVVMPAIPAFAGDLKDESSLGTRAIMDYQYKSINRGGHSIMEEIENAGYDPLQYIRFYNLRSYDRINDGSLMRKVEAKSGIDYEVARREHDDIVDPVGYRAQGGAGQSGDSFDHEHYIKYRKTLNEMDMTGGTSAHWDSVAACYMLNGPDIRSLPWEDGDKAEIDCFVCEELYIHSKVLIADDRIVICGSANLNDRSQLGTHDSEIACVIEDTEEIDSYMNRRPWRATKFAATLRRFLFRKHLGLVLPQNAERPDANFQPPGVPNMYDFDSPEDRLVMDPLADQFLNFWNMRAHTNTQAFGRVFHPVPHDDVKTWADYDKFYEVFFHEAGAEAQGKGKPGPKAKYEWGHVVAENFSGIGEVKDVLSTIKGTLVEMPLLFLIQEDMAKTGLTLNAFTEEVYT